METIEPRRLYCFSEAAKLIPSSHAGKHVHVATLHHWRKAALFTAEYRLRNGRRYWFVFGSEILKLIGAKPPEFVGQTPAERQRAIAAAEKGLRAYGL